MRSYHKASRLFTGTPNYFDLLRFQWHSSQDLWWNFVRECSQEFCGVGVNRSNVQISCRQSVGFYSVSVSTPCITVTNDGDNYEKEDLEILAQAAVFQYSLKPTSFIKQACS